MTRVCDWHFSFLFPRVKIHQIDNVEINLKVAKIVRTDKCAESEKKGKYFFS